MKWRSDRSACGPMATAFQILGAEWLVFVLGICLIGIVALVFGALWMYRDAQGRRLDATVWVVLLVIATLLTGVIGFVIVFVIYLVVRESHPIGGGMPMAYGPYVPVPTEVVPAPRPVGGRPMVSYPQSQRYSRPSCGPSPSVFPKATERVVEGTHGRPA